MSAAVVLSDDSRTSAGVLLLTIIAVEYGGLTLLRSARPLSPIEFQRAFARAGHAHAGVSVIFALVAQILADAAPLTASQHRGPRRHLARRDPLPAGVLPLLGGSPRHQPNRFIFLVYAGAVSLTAGVLALGIELLTAQRPLPGSWFGEPGNPPFRRGSGAPARPSTRGATEPRCMSSPMVRRSSLRDAV
jgi:hypothetical protein